MRADKIYIYKMRADSLAIKTDALLWSSYWGMHEGTQSLSEEYTNMIVSRGGLSTFLTSI